MRVITTRALTKVGNSDIEMNAAGIATARKHYIDCDELTTVTRQRSRHYSLDIDSEARII
jgi:hypothetical protein